MDGIVSEIICIFGGKMVILEYEIGVIITMRFEDGAHKRSVLMY